MGGCTAFGWGCTVKARQGCVLQERLRLLNQALTMELGGRGRGRRLQRGCWEPGSRNGGSKGGTKERQGRERTQALVSVVGMAVVGGGEDVDAHGERRGALSVTFTG